MDSRKDLDDEVDKILRDAKAKKAAEEAANAGAGAEDIPAPSRGETAAQSAGAKEPAEPTEPAEPAAGAEGVAAPEYKITGTGDTDVALAETEEETGEDAKEGGKKRKKGRRAKGERRKLSTPWKVVIIVLAVIIVIAAAFGIIALVTEDNPVTYTTAVVTNSENKLIANWESDEYPGRYAYTFNEDGTYQEYYCNYSFDYEYEATVTHLTLRNPQTGLEEVYKYTISGDTLKLTLVEQYGREIEDGETTVYHKVDTLNMSDIADLAGDL